MELLNNRSHERLEAYWNALRGARPYPAENEIDPDALADIWHSCYLISIDEVTQRLGYRYSYLGHDLIEAYGDDLTNPDIAMRLLSTEGGKAVRKFDEVVRRRVPVFDASEFMNLKHMRIKYRTCMLPLGPDGGAVSHIIGCMSWRAY